jgi:hypothetical protein
VRVHCGIYKREFIILTREARESNNGCLHVGEAQTLVAAHYKKLEVPEQGGRMMQSQAKTECLKFLGEPLV